MCLLLVPEGAARADTSDWYIYNGETTLHSYSVRFPSNWNVKTSGGDIQTFSTSSQGTPYFTIEEFEGLTYDLAIDAYTEDTLVSAEDTVFEDGETGDELIGKEVIYKNSDGTEYEVTFLHRGTLIVALGDSATGYYADIVSQIRDSFSFADEWKQYIDYKNGYSFIFPAKMQVTNLSDGVSISDPVHNNSNVFGVTRYEGIALVDAPETDTGFGEELETTEDVYLLGAGTALSATYYDDEFNKNLSRLFVERDGNSYSISNINIEVNFPNPDYYNSYLIEMIRSFEFFEVEGEDYSFVHFPDVRDNHSNAEAINNLVSTEVINGYPDGTFRPDGEINRAELTKMIVAVKADPDAEEYKDCFPDVKEEWFAPYVCYAKEQKWVSGYDDGEFKPEKKINRVEAMKIVFEALFDEIPEADVEVSEIALDIDPEDWYIDYYVFAEESDLLDKQHTVSQGSNYFYYPGKNIARKEVAEMIHRSLE